MADLINARFVLGMSPENQQISALLGVATAKIDDPLLITADVVVVVASAKTGIDPKVVEQWHTFRELYIPTIVAIVDFEDGDVDFEDMNEGRKKAGTKLCARGKSAAQSKFKVYPSAYANGYAVQVCKGRMPGLDGKKHCSGAYC